MAAASTDCKQKDHRACDGTVLKACIWRGVQGLVGCGCDCHDNDDD